MHVPGPSMHRVSGGQAYTGHARSAGASEHDKQHRSRLEPPMGYTKLNMRGTGTRSTRTNHSPLQRRAKACFQRRPRRSQALRHLSSVGRPSARSRPVHQERWLDWPPSACGGPWRHAKVQRHENALQRAQGRACASHAAPPRALPPTRGLSLGTKRRVLLWRVKGYTWVGLLGWRRLRS
jgi:hypothetical protein